MYLNGKNNSGYYNMKICIQNIATGNKEKHARE
jgi:hypothetical protein